jgi:hypothetical protein
MRRLNVQFSQIEECIRTSLFAVAQLPRNPPLQRGEELLLQLVKADAAAHGKENSRVEFALIFDHVEPDPTGSVSRKHWPDAGKTWPYILHCSETIPTVPFSLEKIGLSKDYGGQTNAMYIEPVDECIMRPMLKGGTDPVDLLQVASVEELLRTIRNQDRVTRLAPTRATRVREHDRRYPDTWLTDALKRFYNHKCQICVHDFEPRYGSPFADSVLIDEPHGAPVSTDILVVCPNHRAIIGATHARFDRRTLLFEFPNGLKERVTLRDHLLVA